MKRILSVFLVLMMLIGTCSVLFSCNNDKKVGKEKEHEEKTYDESSIFCERSLVKGYLTMADGYHTVLAVPRTVKDTAFVGTIVEALGRL